MAPVCTGMKVKCRMDNCCIHGLHVTVKGASLTESLKRPGRKVLLKWNFSSKICRAPGRACQVAMPAHLMRLSLLRRLLRLTHRSHLHATIH